MRITEIKITFDNGGLLHFQYPGGFDLNDFPGVLGLSTESLVNAKKDTWQYGLKDLLDMGFSMLMKRIGL